MNEPQTFVDLQDAGNAQAQLILQAIARHADWETGECFPSQDALAKMAKCTTRTIRNYLGLLEAQGFISRQERRKDSGAKQTDLITLVGYREWISALRGGGEVNRPKRIPKYEQPTGQAENLSGSQEERFSASPGTLHSAPPGKQASANKGTSLNDHRTLDARTREGSKFDLESERAKPSPALPCFTIQPADSSWQAWIDHLRAIDASMAFDATQAKHVRASTRWPNPETQIFEPKPHKAAPNNEGRAA